MKLIVGLGNPGRQYEKTRHNMGFMVADKFAEMARADFDRSMFKGVYAIVRNPAFDEPIIILKPETLMNLSGECVQPLMHYFKIEPEDVIVKEILNDFAEGRLQVLTSMKCLDEGVDVPRSELAIFCSSTGNPRQFIQRRGRVLRTHPDKKMAELHDLVVVPELNPNSDSFRMEQSLLRGELMRVNNFALLSENPSYSEMELRDVMNHYGLNLYNNEHL